MGNPLPNQSHNEQTNLESRAGEARRLLEHLFATLPRLLSFGRSNVPDLASFTESATLECIAELHETTNMLENSVFPIMRECMEQHDNIIETNLLDVLLLRVARLIVARPTTSHSISIQTATFLEVAGAEQAISTARNISNTWSNRRRGNSNERTARVSQLLETVRQQRQHVRSMVYEFLVGREGPRLDNLPESVPESEYPMFGLDN
jgi:hypothetical protein